MTSQIATVLVGILSAAVTIMGWIVLHHLARRKDIEARAAADTRADRLKRLELNLQQLERQVAEFYGPIHNLIYQIWATWEIKHDKIRTVLTDEVYAKVDHHFGRFYFEDLHGRIRDILREKDLVEGGTIPNSFYEYMKHSIMEHVQIDLWESKQISTLQAKGYPWPAEFADDIERGLLVALKQRQALLAELQPRIGA